jgi:outer membrane protein OmpA-like peptidoglycan-associated protein
MKMSRQGAMLLVMCLAGATSAASASSWLPKSMEPPQVAAINQDPEGPAAFCGLDQKYNVIGFNRNSNDLTDRIKARLDQVAADIGGRKCAVQLVGYSSSEGDIASNALFAIERAQKSLTYLRDHGVDFTRATATGAGATGQFGGADANRRVVIIVTP